MTYLLAGDIGGTKTILRLVRSQEFVTSGSLPPQATIYEATYRSADFIDLVPMVGQFLTTATEATGISPEVERACFGIAGPVLNQRSDLTNLSWSLSADRLEQELAIPKVRLLNDFAAIGYGILGLSTSDLYPLQSIPVDTNAPIAVLGAGTGLGQGFLIPLPGGGYRVFPSEGAHADFAPRSPLEFQLLTYLQAKNQIDRVSVERVVSGQGIAAIYQFLRDREPSLESPALTALFTQWQQEMSQSEKTIDLSAEVSKAAIAGQDFLSQQTLRIFMEAYGAEAGNLALKLLPYGGLYVAGGIVTKNLPLIQQGHFLKAFRAKGRMGELMAKIPIFIVLNPKVGLIGAALHAGQL
jgi:glucokinase